MDGFEKRLKEIDKSLELLDELMVDYPQCKETYDRLRSRFIQERAELASKIGRKKCR